MEPLLSRLSEFLFPDPPEDRLPDESDSEKRETWFERPPVVVVCPHCNSGIYQHRSGDAIDCPDCDHIEIPDCLTEYEIIRFDCPDCGSDIEDAWATRDLVGDGPPNTVTHVDCGGCGMSWEAPSNY